MTRSPQIRVSSGELLGQWQGELAVFRGIPFATPPVGPLRWRAPQPVKAWEGVRPALEFGPAPVQPTPPMDGVMFVTNFDDGRALVISEDCLYLNVWTPDPTPGAALPVIVWVHGGGNRYGYGSQAIQEASKLAGRGAVVVSLNHRLGSLGFLAHPGLSAEADGASGNYGLLDIVAVLEWVQENIEACGGDPRNVTLAGNSAGSAHITHLMSAPRARGLFHRVIGQSASGIYRAEGLTPTLSQAENQGVSFAESFGASTIERLRRASSLELIVKGHFGPIIDGVLLREQTQDVFLRGEQAAVPALLGYNTDEGSVYARVESATELEQLLTKYSGTPFASVYRGDTEDALHRSAREFVGDSRFSFPVWRWAKTHVETTGSPTYLYRFNRAPHLPTTVSPPPDGLPGYGVYHTAELLYVWDNLDLKSWNWTPEDYALSTVMADAWVRFASTGKPVTHEQDWTVFDGTLQARELVFSAEGPVLQRIYRQDAMSALDELERPY